MGLQGLPNFYDAQLSALLVDGGYLSDNSFEGLGNVYAGLVVELVGRSTASPSSRSHGRWLRRLRPSRTAVMCPLAPPACRRWGRSTASSRCT